MIKNEIKYHLFFILFFISTIIGNNIFYVPIIFNFYLIRILTFIYCVFFILFDNNSFVLKLFNKYNVNYFLFYVIFLILSTFQLISVKNFDEAFKLVLNIHYQFYFILCFYILLNKCFDFKYTLFYSFFYSVTISLLIALFEIYTNNHLESSNVYISNLPFYAKNWRFANSFFSNPNNCSYFLVLSNYFLILYNKDFSNKIVFKISRFYIFLLIPFILVLNQSTLSLFVYLLTILYFYYNKIKYYLFWLIIILFIFFYSIFFFFSNYIKLEINSQSFNERFNHINNFFYYSFHNPFFGLGPKQYESLNRHFFYNRVSNPHNFLIELSLNHGIPILLFFVTILFKKIYHNYMLKRIDTLFFNIIFILLLTQNSGYLDNLIFWLFLSLFLFEFKNEKYS
jgi:hypothetical protein